MEIDLHRLQKQSGIIGTSEKIFDFAEIQYMQIPLTSSTMEWIFQIQIVKNIRNIGQVYM